MLGLKFKPRPYEISFISSIGVRVVESNLTLLEGEIKFANYKDQKFAGLRLSGPVKKNGRISFDIISEYNGPFRPAPGLRVGAVPALDNGL